MTVVERFHTKAVTRRIAGLWFANPNDAADYVTGLWTDVDPTHPLHNQRRTVADAAQQALNDLTSLPRGIATNPAYASGVWRDADGRNLIDHLADRFGGAVAQHLLRTADDLVRANPLPYVAPVGRPNFRCPTAAREG